MGGRGGSRSVASDRSTIRLERRLASETDLRLSTARTIISNATLRSDRITVASLSRALMRTSLYSREEAEDLARAILD